jgi:tetratricopeptide (TPR) repeat protein
MMSFSRLGVLVLLTITVMVGANCSYYNRVMARKNLVDGSTAYKDRKFDQAAELFRAAIARDPEGEYIEGQTAQVFLARTLHSEYIGNRDKVAVAEQAIAEYQKALTMNPGDQSSYKAIASLYENLQRGDDWLKWVTARANSSDIAPEQRAEAFTSLAAKKNTCANDITDTEKTKKTVTKDGKSVFEFVKPEKPEDFEELKKCVAEGNQLIEQAVALEPEMVKNAKSLDLKAMSDSDLRKAQDMFKVFESARSFRASLLVQAMRTAEMEGRNEDRDRLRAESDAARERFTEMSEVVKRIQAEIDERIAAAKPAPQEPS